VERKPKRILVLVSAPKLMHLCRQRGLMARLKTIALPIPTDNLELEKKYLEALRGYSGKANKVFGGIFREACASIRAGRSLGLKIDLFVVSPRYGIIGEDDIVVPYAFSLSRLSKSEVRAISLKLKVKERLLSILKLGYDLVYLMCNKKDLLMVNDPEMGFRIEEYCNALTVIAAPSSSVSFGKGVIFHGRKYASERSALLAKMLEDLNIRHIDEY